MEFSKEQINKIKLIYQKQVEINGDIYKKDKWGFVWFIGTDFFSHLSRINNLYIWILENLDIDFNNEEIFLEWKKSIIRKKDKDGKFQNRYYLNIYKEVNLEYKYLKSAVFGQKNKEWIFEEKQYFNNENNVDDLIARTTMHQFLEIMASLGYIEIHNDINPDNIFSLIVKSQISNNYIIDKIELASTFVDNFEIYFNLKYIKGYSIRDIFLGLHIFFLYELWKNDSSMCSNIEINQKGKKNRNIAFLELFKPNNHGKSTMEKHYKAQTTLKNLIEKDLNLAIIIFDKLNNFLFKKYAEDWKTKNLTVQSQVLEIYIKNNGRSGQVQYRQLLLNDIKRYVEKNNQQFINKNDLIWGMKIPIAIEASHIVPFASEYILKNEKYDPENGLLLDASIHTLFDQNKLIFDSDGHIWIEKDNYHEIVYQIGSGHLEHSLISSVLTLETKKYIKKRLKSNNINFRNYQRFE